MRQLLAAVAVALGLCGAQTAAAAYPDKPIRLVLPVPPGGSSDAVARILARYLGDRLKQTIVVENKAGAAGNIAAGDVARSAPDGYTLLMSTGPFAINPSLFKTLPFDTLRDFTPVAQLTQTPSLLVVNPKVPAATMQEFIAMARKASAPIAVASPGNGTAQHLALELLRKRAGVSFVHVPYKGGAPALNDVLGGQVPAMMVGFTEGLTYVRNGQLRALAVTSATRSSLLPQVPTLMELKLADAPSGGWNGIHVRAGTPPDVVTRLHDEINAVLAMPEVRKLLANAGFEVRARSQHDFDVFVREQMAMWKAAVKLTGAKAE